MKIKNILYNCVKYIYLLLFSRDYKSINCEAKNIFVSYLSEPFYIKNDNQYFNAHQNRRETIIMADIFTKMNYSFHFVRLDKPLWYIGKYDIVYAVWVIV